MGNPLFMHIVSISQDYQSEPIETFQSHDDSIEGTIPNRDGIFNLTIGVVHETFEGKSEPIMFNLGFVFLPGPSQNGGLKPHHFSLINAIGKLLLFVAAFGALYMTIKACLAKR